MGCHQQDRVKLDASYMERAFLCVLLFTTVLSLQLIALLGIECFTPGWVALSSLLSLPISVFLFRVQQRPDGGWRGLHLHEKST